MKKHENHNEIEFVDPDVVEVEKAHVLKDIFLDQCEGHKLLTAMFAFSLAMTYLQCTYTDTPEDFEPMLQEIGDLLIKYTPTPEQIFDKAWEGGLKNEYDMDANGMITRKGK